MRRRSPCLSGMSRTLAVLVLLAIFQGRVVPPSAQAFLISGKAMTLRRRSHATEIRTSMPYLAARQEAATGRYYGTARRNVEHNFFRWYLNLQLPAAYEKRALRRKKSAHTSRMSSTADGDDVHEPAGPAASGVSSSLGEVEDVSSAGDSNGKSSKLPGVAGSGGNYGDDDDDDDDDDGDRRVENPHHTEASLIGLQEDEDDDEPDSQMYEEIIANMTKPLGITIEASTDEAELVYITSVGEQAQDAGLQVGDVLTGTSGVYGDDIWSVKGDTVEKIRSKVRCRDEPYILLRVERGHVSLEERCQEGFGEDEGCGVLDIYEETEMDFIEMWEDVYAEEMAVNTEGAMGSYSKDEGDENGDGNDSPPTYGDSSFPRGAPGTGAFSNSPWEMGDF